MYGNIFMCVINSASMFACSVASMSGVHVASKVGFHVASKSVASMWPLCSRATWRPCWVSIWLLCLASKWLLCLPSMWLLCLNGFSLWFPSGVYVWRLSGFHVWRLSGFHVAFVSVCYVWLLNASQCLCSLPSTWSLRRAFNCVIAAYASRPCSGLVVSTCGFRCFDLMWLLIFRSEDPSLNPSTQHQEAQLTLVTFHSQTLATSPT